MHEFNVYVLVLLLVDSDDVLEFLDFLFVLGLDPAGYLKALVSFGQVKVESVY